MPAAIIKVFLRIFSLLVIKSEYSFSAVCLPLCELSEYVEGGRVDVNTYPQGVNRSACTGAGGDAVVVGVII